MLLDFGVRSKKWSFLINPTRDFGVIIPESIDNIKELNAVYGLKNLKYVLPDQLANLKKC